MKGMEACKLKWKEESPELTFQCLQLFIFSTQSSWNAMRKLWFPLEPDSKLQNEFMTLADSQFWGSLATSEAWHGTVFSFWRVCWFLHFYLKTPLLFQITLFVCDFPVIRGARWNLRNLSLSLSFSVSYIIHLLYQVVDSTWCTYCQCFMCFFVHEFVSTSVSSARPGTVNTTDTTDTTTKGTGTTGVRAGQNGVRAGSQGTAGLGSVRQTLAFADAMQHYAT